MLQDGAGKTVCYDLRRGKTETWREFFSRWDTALRKVSEHKVVLPEEYQGFLLINGLQLSDNETKAMLNYTPGRYQAAFSEGVA